MRTIHLSLVASFACALVVVGCSASPTPSSPSSELASSSAAALGGDAGACAPSVTVSASSCSVTVSGTTCSCTDAPCVAGAIEACVGVTGLLDGGAGFPIPDAAFPIPFPLDAGWPGVGWLPDGGSASPACDAKAVTAAKAQFCSDVDAWLSSHGSSASLDCAQVGSISFPIAVPPSLPAPSPSGITCGAATHDAFVKAQTTLASCNPVEYLGWDSSAQLQLFEAGACMP